MPETLSLKSVTVSSASHQCIATSILPASMDTTALDFWLYLKNITIFEIKFSDVSFIVYTTFI